MKIITRVDAANKLDALGRGDLTVAALRAWTGRLLAADEMEIADADALVVARIINVVEDAGVSDADLESLASQLAAVVRFDVADEIRQALISLIVDRERFIKVFDRVARGIVSEIGLNNALSSADLSPAVRQRLRSMSVEARKRLLAALIANDHRAVAATLI